VFRSFILLLACQMVVATFVLCPLTQAQLCGDFNYDGIVNVADIVYLMNYCFLNGPPPPNPDSAEADGYQFLNIRDAVYLVNYLFWSGPPPTNCPATNPEYQCNLEPADTIIIPPTTLPETQTSISVPVWYKNSKPIRGIALPLKVNVGEQIPHIDSVVLGVRTSDAHDWISSDDVTGTVNGGLLWMFQDSLLPPGSGPIFTLYLSIDPEEIDRRVLIDTLRLSPSNSPMFIEPNTNGDMPFFIGLRPDSLPFAPVVNYPTGTQPYSVFCADLDGDGDLDLAVTNEGSVNVSVFKNYGDGTFPVKDDYETGNLPASVFCADLDGDGDLDLAVARPGSNSVSILMNNGNGTFDNLVTYGVGNAPYSVFCADLDGDGDLDLAVANANSDNVSILKNNGDGTFQDTVNYGVGDTPYSVFCADLDGDADLDLATANEWGDNVSILKNRGDGTFQPKADYPAGNRPLYVFCSDLDGDGDLDLAVANANSDNVSILKNIGNGTFENAVNYGTGDFPYYVFCADLDGDNDLELVVANYYSNNVSILKNNGNGTFKEAVNYGAGVGPTSVFCADLDGDGDFDLAVPNFSSDNVSILKNLTQIPANQPPWAFHLISPGPTDTTQHLANFVWRIPYDPNLGDQIRYDLYVSTTPGFEPQNTIVDSNLTVSHHTDELEIGTYYWKVKAKDNWGAYSWSQVTFSFFHSDYISDTVTIVAFSPVDLIVTDPVGDSIGIGFNTIPGADYDITTDWDHDGDNDDIVTIPDRLVGDYLIEVVAESGDTGVYDLGIRIDGSNIMNLATDHPSPSPGEPDTFSYNVPWYVRGDANGDWVVSVTDVVYLINHLFIGGPGPEVWQAGDANCDETINVSDVVYLINYLFISGPPPCN
jgi:ankyrin repeat protein